MRIEVVLQSLKTTNESLRRGFLKIHVDIQKQFSSMITLRSNQLRLFRVMVHVI